jgi:hypothetical protein
MGKYVKAVYITKIIDYEEPDLMPTLDGGIKYKGFQLNGLSMDNQPGKVLIEFTRDGVERFVSDETLRRIVGADTAYRDWGYIMRDLKKYLKKEGLDPVIIRRRTNKGYTLKTINELDDRYMH